MEVTSNFVDLYVFYPCGVGLQRAFGKWIVFCFKRQMDAVWELLHPLMDHLTQCGEALCMRASTGRPNPYAQHSDIGVIMIFTEYKKCEQTTRKIILDVGEALRKTLSATTQFSPYSRIFYKTQDQSRQGSRMTGRLQNNTLTSIRLPDDCVSQDDRSSMLWTHETQTTDTKKEAPMTLTPKNLHMMGANWDPHTNHWYAPNTQVLQKMINVATADITQSIPISKDHVSLLTMNVWGNIDTFLHPDSNVFERMQSILCQIETLQPDIICLQEVQKTNLEVLHPCLVAQGYLAVDPENRSVVTYVHSVYLRLEWSECAHDPVRIETVCVKHKATSTLICVSNVHFPSGIEHANLRLSALQQSLLHLQMPHHAWMLAGDTNLTYDQDADRVLPLHVCDAWKQAGSPMDKRATYDYQKNTNLRGSAPGERFDRVFFDNTKMTLTDFKLACTSKCKDTQKHPSDHFGVFVCVAI